MDACVRTRFPFRVSGSGFSGSFDSSFFVFFSSNFPLSIPVLSDPVFLAAEVSGAESSSLAPERVSGVCVHPVSSLFVSPPHSTFRAPQSSWWSLYSVQNRGGPG